MEKVEGCGMRGWEGEEEDEVQEESVEDGE